jgi:hypothetical protein
MGMRFGSGRGASASRIASSIALIASIAVSHHPLRLVLRCSLHCSRPAVTGIHCNIAFLLIQGRYQLITALKRRDATANLLHIPRPNLIACKYGV